MIVGVSKKAIPYVLEEDRRNSYSEQTVFWIMPKKGHDANETLRRYAAAGRDGRKGYRELNTSRLDQADVEEFLDVVVKVENFQFSEDYPDLSKQGLIKTIEDQGTLVQVCKDLSVDHLLEIFDAANNISHLKAGEKKTPASDVLHVVEVGKAGKKS